MDRVEQDRTKQIKLRIQSFKSGSSNRIIWATAYLNELRCDSQEIKVGLQVAVRFY